MKFKIDANLPAEFAEILSEAGYDATTTRKQGLSSAGDSLIADVCAKEGRVLVTLDLDFADVRAFPPRQFPGFIVFRLRKHGRNFLLQVFRSVIPMLKSTGLEHRLWIIEEHRIRVREDKEK